MAVVRHGEGMAPASARGRIQFRCDVLYVGDRAVVVTRGEVDLDTATELHRQTSAVLALPVAGMTVDLGYVTFIDSSGVNALLQAQKAADEHGIAFRLDAVPRQAHVVLDVLGLLDRFGLSE